VPIGDQVKVQLSGIADALGNKLLDNVEWSFKFGDYTPKQATVAVSGMLLKASSATIKNLGGFAQLEEDLERYLQVQSFRLRNFKSIPVVLGGVPFSSIGFQITANAEPTATSLASLLALSLIDLTRDPNHFSSYESALKYASACMVGPGCFTFFDFSRHNRHRTMIA
jgi:hypothetical protein